MNSPLSGKKAVNKKNYALFCIKEAFNSEPELGGKNE